MCAREKDNDANNASFSHFHIHPHAVHAHTHTVMGELFVAARLSTTFFPHCSPLASHSLISHVNTNTIKLVSLEAAEFQGVFTVSTVRRSLCFELVCKMPHVSIQIRIEDFF